MPSLINLSVLSFASFTAQGISNYNQRHLLQMTNVSLPITTHKFCYPDGTCGLGALSDGSSGFVLQGEAKSDRSGYSVSGIGDINGDEVSDIILGASGASSAAGKNYVIFGSRNNRVWGNGVLNLAGLMDGQRGFALQGAAANDRSGLSSAAGDINGDGVPDLLVGASIGSYVVFGSKNSSIWGNGLLNLATLTNGQRGFLLQGAAYGSGFGSVSTAGDVDGDGVSDIILASSMQSQSYVVLGSKNSSAWGNGVLNITTLANGQRGFLLQGAIGDAWYSVSTAGDINGDGVSDIIMGSYNAGKSYVVFGSRNNSAWGGGVLNLTTLMDGQRGFVLQGEVNSLTGYSVGSIGDLNGDGISEIIVGAVAALSGAGKSYVVFGSRNSSAWGNGVLNLTTLMDGQRGFVLQGETANDQSGSSVGTAGDINGDGISDIIVGAYSTSRYAGKSYVVFGSRNSSAWSAGTLNLGSLVDGQRGFALKGEVTNDYSGSPISAAGDMNGDGVPDIIVGASGALLQAGKSYVVFGGKPLPFYFTVNYLLIGAGETVPLTPQNLMLASTCSDLNVSTLRIRMENVANGYFAFNATPSVSLSTFYMQNISDGVVQFVHTGGALMPQYRVVADFPPPLLNALETVIFSEAQIDFIGYRPNRVNNQLKVNQGLPTLLENNDLSASDQDNGPKDLFFIINNLTHGQFTLYNTTINTTQNATQFSQQNVLDRNVQFIHDGSRNPPSYFVAITDGKSTTGSQAATITFNYAPELTIASSVLILDQGQETTLDSRDFNATDVETVADKLIIYTENLTYGYFTYTGNPNFTITAFQQFSLATGGVQFIQNGSAVVPTFTLQAFDGILYSSWQIPFIQLNHRPLLQGYINEQSVTQGDHFSFTIPSNLFTDPDANDKLTYYAQLTGGVPLPIGLNFIPPQQFSGTLVDTGSFNIEVGVRDPRGLKASTTFILFSQESKAAYYRALYTTFSGLGGVGGAVLLYLWLRRRIAKHRADCVLANAMRNTLNLEYYDFMYFAGGIYKSKVNDFLLGLQSTHQEFYAQLTSEEQNSFAVCVAEILVARNLVSRSDYAGGLFALLCCLSVGWPMQLNMQALEVQRVEITAEAVRTWKNCEDPLRRWPYSSPTVKDSVKAFCCARPSRAGIFSANLRLMQNTPLETLKKHETADSSLKINSVSDEKKPPNSESRALSFIEEFTQKTSAAMEVRDKKIETMTQKIAALQESRPLLEQGR